jgi:hypothetical protein
LSINRRSSWRSSGLLSSISGSWLMIVLIITCSPRWHDSREVLQRTPAAKTRLSFGSS